MVSLTYFVLYYQPTLLVLVANMFALITGLEL